MSHSKIPTKTKFARPKSRAKRPAKPANIPSRSTRGGTKQEAVMHQQKLSKSALSERCPEGKNSQSLEGRPCDHVVERNHRRRKANGAHQIKKCSASETVADGIDELPQAVGGLDDFHFVVSPNR